MSVMAFAQAGYKNLTFGMSAEQVTKLVPDAKKFTGHGGSILGEYALFMYLFNAEVGSLWNSKTIKVIPQLEFTGVFAMYRSEKEQLRFSFINDKLYGVNVDDISDNVLSDLETKYGDKKVITLNDYDSVYVDTAVWLDGKRFIVYCKYYGYESLQYYTTTVFYYDADYLNPLMEKAMQKFRASKSRLD